MSAETEKMLRELGVPPVEDGWQRTERECVVAALVAERERVVALETALNAMTSVAATYIPPTLRPEEQAVFEQAEFALADSRQREGSQT